MVKMKKLTKNELEFKRFQIPNNFVISPKGKITKEISIKSPKLCPICGNEEIIGDFKLNSDNYKKFVKVFMCKDHAI